jgi:hypothetical protein
MGRLIALTTSVIIFKLLINFNRLPNLTMSLIPKSFTKDINGRESDNDAGYPY